MLRVRTSDFGFLSDFGFRTSDFRLGHHTTESQTIRSEGGLLLPPDLRGGVEKALETLGQGFVSHPKNTALRSIQASYPPPSPYLFTNSSPVFLRRSASPLGLTTVACVPNPITHISASSILFSLIVSRSIPPGSGSNLWLTCHCRPRTSSAPQTSKSTTTSVFLLFKAGPRCPQRAPCQLSVFCFLPLPVKPQPPPNDHFFCNAGGQFLSPPMP